MQYQYNCNKKYDDLSKDLEKKKLLKDIVATTR